MNLPGKQEAFDLLDPMNARPPRPRTTFPALVLCRIVLEVRAGILQGFYFLALVLSRLGWRLVFLVIVVITPFVVSFALSWLIQLL